MQKRSSLSLVLGLLVLGLGISAGCAGATDAPSDSEAAQAGDSPQVEGQEQSLIGGGNENSCCWGSYTCARTGDSFDYEPPRCGPDPTKPRAASACKSACGVACQDSGWYCP
jgi:hypothetical protein